MEVDAVLSYSGSQDARYYEALRVDKNGRICQRPRLTRREIDWLNEIGADTMLWDGTLGRQGIAFDVGTCSSPTATASKEATGIIGPRTPRVRFKQHLKGLTPRSRTRLSSPRCFRLLPVPITLERARNLLAALPKNDKVATSPTATAQLNNALLFNPDSPKAAMSGSLEMQSFVEEARLRGQQRTPAATRAWEATFARPAVLATVGPVTENACAVASTVTVAEGSFGVGNENETALISVPAEMIPERVQYIATRRLAMSCLKAFVDCTEALELLHAAEMATLAAAKALPGPPPGSLGQVASSIERDVFVGSVLSLCSSKSELITGWTSLSAEIPQIARAKRAKANEIYARLHAAHRILGKSYREVEQVKQRASSLAKEHEEKLEVAWQALLAAWERLIISDQ